jgi:hypothetical protein
MADCHGNELPVPCVAQEACETAKSDALEKYQSSQLGSMASPGSALEQELLKVRE